jgi:2-oxo-hept-3-ene-1,7-dioate hydratase
MRPTRLALTFAAILAAPGLASAECASDVAIARYVADWQAGTPTEALGAGASMEDALCTQEKLVERLQFSRGEVVGYKAGLTSDAAQERFGVDEPVRGVLLGKMLLEDGARVAEDFGARPLFEADLLLVIGDAAINEADGRAAALRHISAVRPFIELPDLAVSEGQPITGATLTAGNVGARLGVMGAPIEVTERFLDHLEVMTVRVTDADGEVLAETKGSAVLGHPVESVLWLVRSGVRLEEGDLVSVGSIGPLMPPAKAKGRATVTYEGLPGDPSVSVTFTR